MIVRTPDYYSEFKCLGDTCPDTCCVGWLIEIDEQSYARFMALEGEIGQKIQSNIFMNDEGKPCFKLDDSGRCAFLNEKNLCQMYIDLGPDSQCSLCDNYPRIGEEFGSYRELGLSVSCPEVARILLEHKETIAFEEWETSEAVNGNDCMKSQVFCDILGVRDAVIAIMQNKEYSINDKLCMYVMIATRLQQALDNRNYDDIGIMADDYTDEGYVASVLESLATVRGNASGKLVDTGYVYMSQLDYISTSWVELLNSIENADNIHTGEEYWYENWLVYLVYRYFMKVISDGDIYGKAMFAVFSTVMLTDIVEKYGDDKERAVKVFYLFSKEVEHCEENMEYLYDRFYEDFWSNPRDVIQGL